MNITWLVHLLWPSNWLNKWHYTVTYSPPSVCALHFSFLTLSHSLYFVIPDYFQPCLQHTRVSLNPYILLQCPCKSLSGYLLEFSYTISIASGKLLMKKLKEIQAIALQSYMQNIIQFEAWITNNYFLNELAPIGHRFHQSSSLSFLLLFQIVTVYPFSTSIIPSQLMTRQLDQEKRSEVWLQCSSIPAQKPARPSFSWFFTLLLNWYRVHEVSLFFFLGTGKTHLPIKDHK